MKEKDCFSFETIVTNVSSLYCMTSNELLTTKFAVSAAMKTLECLAKNENSNVDLVWLYRETSMFMKYLNIALKERYLEDVEAEIELFEGKTVLIKAPEFNYFEDEFDMLYCLDIMPISEMVEIPTYEELFPEDED